MKKWVSTLICFLFSFQAFATDADAGFHIPEEAPSFFISHEQFMSLTNEEQKTYVKKVREMVVEMSTTFPYFAEEMSARSNLFKFFMNIAMPDATAEDASAQATAVVDSSYDYAVTRSLQNAMGYDKQINSAKFATLSDSQKKELIEKYRQSLYWVATAATQAQSITDPKLHEKNVKIVNGASRAVLSSEAKIRSIASDGDISYARDEVLKKALAGDKEVTTSFPYPGLKTVGEKLSEEQPLPEPVPPKIPIESLPPPPPAAPDVKDPTLPKTPEVPAAPTEPAPVAPVAPAPAPQAPEKKDAKKPKLPNPKIPDLMKPSKDPKNKDIPGVTIPAGSNYYRCIFAGFVVKKDPCLSGRTLPWELEGLNEAKFKCDRPTLMCNPFVFGFKSNCDWDKALASGKIDKCLAEAKPYCITPGMSATKACADMSNKTSALQAAVELIKRNKAAFKEFGQSFNDLCYKNLIDLNSYPRKRTAQNIARTRKDIKATCEVAKKRMDEVEKRYGMSKDKDGGKKGPTGKDLLMVKPENQKGTK